MQLERVCTCTCTVELFIVLAMHPVHSACGCVLQCVSTVACLEAAEL